MYEFGKLIQIVAVLDFRGGFTIRSLNYCYFCSLKICEVPVVYVSVRCNKY